MTTYATRDYIQATLHRWILRLLFVVFASTAGMAALAAAAENASAEPNTGFETCQWGTFDGTSIVNPEVAGSLWSVNPMLAQQTYDTMGYRREHGVWTWPRVTGSAVDANQDTVIFPVTYRDKWDKIRPLRRAKVTIKFLDRNSTDESQAQIMGYGRLDDWGRLTMEGDGPLNRPAAFPVDDTSTQVHTPRSNPDYTWRVWFEYTLDDALSVAVYPPATPSAPYVIRTNTVVMDSFPEEYLYNPESTPPVTHLGYSCDWELADPIPGTTADRQLDLQPLTTQQQAALFAYDAIREAHDYAEPFLANTGGAPRVLPQIDVTTPVTKEDDPRIHNAAFFFFPPQIKIGSDYTHNLDTIQHEYGHFVSDQTFRARALFNGIYLWSARSTGYPGTVRTTTPPYEDVPQEGTKSLATRLVLSESFPDFLAVSTQKDTVRRLGGYDHFPFAPGSPDLGDTIMYDLDPLSPIPLDVNGPADGSSDGYRSLGEDNRASVTRLLYQVAQLPRADGKSLMAAMVQPGMVRDAENLSEFYRWFVMQGTNPALALDPAHPFSDWQRQVDCLFTGHGVSPEITSLEDGAVVGRAPLQVRVQPGNDREQTWERSPDLPTPPPNDEFMLEVWNDDYTQRYSDSSWTAPRGQDLIRVNADKWNAVWDAHKGERLHVTVLGWSSGGDYVSGPYRSCAKTITLLRDTTMTVRYQPNETPDGGLANPGYEPTGAPARGVRVMLKRWFADLGDTHLDEYLTNDNGEVHVSMTNVGVVNPHGYDEFNLFLDIKAQGVAGTVTDELGTPWSRQSRLLTLRRSEPINGSYAPGVDPMDFTQQAVTTMPDPDLDPRWTYEAAVAQQEDSGGTPDHTLMIFRADAALPDPADFDEVAAVRDGFEVHDALYSAREHVTWLDHGTEPPGGSLLTVRTGATASSFDGTGLTVRTETGAVPPMGGPKWDDVFHFYAKWLSARRGVPASVLTPAPDSAVNRVTTSSDKAAGLDRAWADGFADYFAVAARIRLDEFGRLPLRDLLPVPGDAVRPVFGGSLYSYDLAAPVPAEIAGDGGQRSVAAALFRLSTDRSDNEVWELSTRDGLSVAHAQRLAVFDTRVHGAALPWSEAEFRRYGCVLSAAGIGPALAEGTELDLSQVVPGTVSWSRGGSSGGVPGDVFRLQVFNGSFTAELLSLDLAEPVSAGPSVSYTFTQAEWDDLRASAGGSTHVVVSGRQLAAPATPSDTGWYPGCASGGEPLLGDVAIAMEMPDGSDVDAPEDLIVRRSADAAREVFEAGPDSRVSLVLYSDWDCQRFAYTGGVEQFIDLYYAWTAADLVPASCEPRVLVPFQSSLADFEAAVAAALDLPGRAACWALGAGGQRESKDRALVEAVAAADACVAQWKAASPLNVSFYESPESGRGYTDQWLADHPDWNKSAGLSAVRLALGQPWRVDPAVSRHVLLLNENPVKETEVLPSGEVLTVQSIVAEAVAVGVGAPSPGTDSFRSSARTGDSADGRRVAARTARDSGVASDAAVSGAAVSLAGGAGAVRVHTVQADGLDLDGAVLGLAVGTGGTVELAGPGSVGSAVSRVLAFIRTGQGGPVTGDGAGLPSVSITTSTADRTATAVPATVPLSASVAPASGRSIVSVEWDFDYDGHVFTPQASGESVSHVFDAEFVGSVAVRATDSAGATRVVTAGVYVNGVPAVTPSGGPWQADSVPGRVPFHVSGWDPAGVDHWEWDFDGDDTFEIGEVTSGPDNEHLFTSVFDGPVRVRVVDRFGAFTEAILPVQVFQAPHAVIAGGPFTATGFTKQFIMDGSGSTPGSGGPIVGFEWDWNNDGRLRMAPGFPMLSDVVGGVEAATATSARYVAPFDGTARLTVIDAAGHRGSTTVPVRVESHPPALTINGDTGTGTVVVSAKRGMPYMVEVTAADPNGTVTAVGADTVYWLDKGLTSVVEGTLTATSAQFVVMGWAAGRSAMTLPVWARDNDGEYARRDVVVVFDEALPAEYPQAAIAMSPTGDCPTLPCAKTFTATPAGAGMTYRWDFDGDYRFDSTTATASHTWNQVTSVQVLVEVTDAQGRRGYARQAVSAANPAPVARLAVPSNPHYYLPVTFDASGSTDDTTITTYEWDFDDDGRFERTSSEPVVDHIVWDASTSLGRVTVKVTDEFGASSSTTISVSDRIALPTPATPVPAGTAVGMAPWMNGPYEGLPGTSVTFDAAGSSVAAPSVSIVEYAWDVEGDGIIDHVGPESSWTREFPTAVEGTTWLRIKDSLGRYAVRSMSLRVNWPVPTVEVAGGPMFEGQLPQLGRRIKPFTFDASSARSHAPGGTIVNYEWFLESSAQLEPVSCGDRFATACDARWKPWASGADKSVVTKEFGQTTVHGYVRVTDSAGLSATSHFDVRVTDGPAQQVDAGGPYTCRVVYGAKCRLTGPVEPRLPVAETDLHAPGYASFDWLMDPAHRHDPWWRWRCEENMGSCTVGSAEHPDWATNTLRSYDFPSWGHVEPEILMRANFPNAANHMVYATAQVNQVPNVQNVVLINRDGNALPAWGYTGTTGTAVSLTAQASAINGARVVRHEWDVDDDGTVDATTTGPTLDWVYATAGTHTARVTTHFQETGTFGRQNAMVWDTTATTTTLVSVVDVLTADAGPDQIAQPNVPLTLTGTGAGGAGLTYTWDFGDGTTGTGATVTHTWTYLATHTVRLTVRDNAGRTATDTTTVTVAAPAPVADAGPDQTAITTGDLVTLTGAGSTGANLTYRWYVDGVLISTSTTPTATYTWWGLDSGTKIVTLTVTDSYGASDTDTVTIEVRPYMVVDAGATRTVTYGQNTTFNGTAWGGSGVYPTFEWDFGDGETATGMTVTHRYTATGTYNVQLTVHDSQGRSSVDIIAATVEARPACAYCTELEADNPAGWWRLGEPSGTNALDATGRGNHGTYTGATLGQPGAIHGDTAARFNAAGNSRVNLPNLNPSNQPNMTLETWVNTTSTGSTLRFIGDYKSTSSSSAGGGYLGMNSTGRPGYWIAWPDPDGTGPATGYTANIVSTRTINDGTWHHIAVTRTPTTLTLHIDGAIDSTYTSPAGTTIPTQPMTGTYLGQRFTTAGTGTFTLDEPAIHTTTLTPERITTHHTTGRDSSLLHADAGPDITTTNPTTTLIGNASGGTAPYTYTWTYDDSTPPTTGQTTTRTFTTGTHTITLTTTDNTGTTTTDTTTITINPPT